MGTCGTKYTLFGYMTLRVLSFWKCVSHPKVPKDPIIRVFGFRIVVM